MVICHVYKRITTTTLDIGRLKRKYFVQAYARLVAHFSVLEDDYGFSFAEAAEKIYRKLSQDGRLDEIKSVDVLTAAIYCLSEVNAAGIEGEKIYSFFEVQKEQIDNLLRDI